MQISPKKGLMGGLFICIRTNCVVKWPIFERFLKEEEVMHVQKTIFRFNKLFVGPFLRQGENLSIFKKNSKNHNFFEILTFL